MGFVVSDEILKQTTKCTKAYRCLSGDVYRICTVAPSPGSGHMVCVNTVAEDYCDYRKHPQSQHACTCPVRKELYHRYGV